MIGFVKTMLIFNILDSIFTFFNNQINISLLKDKLKDINASNIKYKIVYEDLCGYMIDYIEQNIFTNSDDLEIISEIDFSDTKSIIKIITTEYFIIRSFTGTEIGAVELYFNLLNSPFKRSEALKRAVIIYNIAKQCDFDSNKMKDYFNKIIGK